MASALPMNMFRCLEHLTSDTAVWVVMRDWIFTILFVWWHLISNEKVDDNAVECGGSINNFHYASLITGSQSFFSLWSCAFECTHLVLPSNERWYVEWWVVWLLSGNTQTMVCPFMCYLFFGRKRSLFKCQTCHSKLPVGPNLCKPLKIMFISSYTGVHNLISYCYIVLLFFFIVTWLCWLSIYTF